MTTTALRGLYRPHAVPSPGLPLGARSVGEYRVSPGWKDTPFCKSFFQIFWGIAGKGRIIIENEPYELSADMIAIYAPGMRHQVESLDVPWYYRWWTVDGPEAVALMNRLGLRPGMYPGGAAPVALFGELEGLITQFSREAELEAGAVAYRMLAVAAARIAPAHGPAHHAQSVSRVIELCRRHWGDCDCNVEFLARRMGVHRSSLSRTFSAAMGVGLAEYLSGMRLENARSLLRETGMPVAEIARQCGFTDPDYFARLFKTREGMTPRDYRKVGFLANPADEIRLQGRQ